MTRLFDIRADREIQQYQEGPKSGVTSSAFSSSGRYLFTGCDDNTVQVYCTLSGN
jgi:WD40 repeat protein